MSDFAPKREKVEEILDFAVLVSKADDGVTEQRRLKSQTALIGWKIQTPALTYAQMTAYRDHFLAEYGATTAFTFTSPFDQTEYSVRFVPGSFRTVYERGVFTMQFELKRLP